jgi:hypothetical protein
LVESTNATIEILQEPEISIEAGMTADTMVNELGSILNKYEVMNKLMMLSEYESLEFITDDSGSMTLQTFAIFLLVVVIRVCGRHPQDNNIVVVNSIVGSHRLALSSSRIVSSSRCLFW